MRPSFDHIWTQVAAVVAQRGTCPRLQVGAVIVSSSGKIVSTGYNGSPSWLEHCEDVGCVIEPETGRCVSGGTVISKYQTGHYNSRHRTIKEIWEMWVDPYKRSSVRSMKIKSITNTGLIVPDRIVDVWKSGFESTYRVTTSLGRTVTTTTDHKFLGEFGWVALSNLTVGDKVALNGKFIFDDYDWLYHQYVTLKKSSSVISGEVGCASSTVHSALRRLGIKERHVGGGWNKGLPFDEHPKFKGTYTTNTSARQASRKLGLQKFCDVCGLSENLEVHHVDENPYNTSENNLRTLCLKCHIIAHTPHAKLEAVKFDIITNIEYVGEEDVFDLTTETEHSFVGDGFALHNCKRTVHAEANALLQAGSRARGGTLYCTHQPCMECSNLIINAGIKRVVFIHGYTSQNKELQKTTLENYKRSCISLEQVSEGEE